MQNTICPRIEDFLSRCKYPYIKKLKTLYLHPEDLIIIHRLVHFLPSYAAAKVFPDQMLPKGIEGFLLGYAVFVQDDIMILLLAMKGDKGEH